ncbi:hypothetical protein [uncultured Nocardioides sp.]|uniref:hypothetical protein n=1 Tax=uncultured Nocardioides sp. TaxID=198441 RepID=UPI002623CA49|nr:hypothetical protein [uncultured Nocardioides sp.]
MVEALSVVVAAWTWQHDTLTVLASNTTGRATEIAVLLDDRADQFGTEHKFAWNDWLRLSNLLNLRLQEAHLVTYGQVVEGAAPAPSGAEGELAEQAVGAELELLQVLAGSDLAAPVLGHEKADGLPIDVAWPDQHVAVDLGLPEDDRAELVDLGWTVVPADLDAIRTALAHAGGQ